MVNSNTSNETQAFTPYPDEIEHQEAQQVKYEFCELLEPEDTIEETHSQFDDMLWVEEQFREFRFFEENRLEMIYAHRLETGKEGHLSVAAMVKNYSLWEDHFYEDEVRLECKSYERQENNIEGTKRRDRKKEYDKQMQNRLLFRKEAHYWA